MTITSSAGASEIIAGTVADAIRERLIAHTPVTSAHEALILAYTVRMEVALAQFAEDAGLDAGGWADIGTALTKAVNAATAAGFPAPVLP